MYSIIQIIFFNLQYHTTVLGKICDILTHCKLISPLSSHSLCIIHFFIRKSFGIKKILDDARQKILKEESYIPRCSPFLTAFFMASAIRVLVAK